MRKIVFILMFCLLFPGFAFAKAPVKGEAAPDISVTSMEGENLTLSSLKGKVVLMGMFHICVPCMNQALEFEKVRKQIGSDQLEVVGINTNGDSKSDVSDYLKQFPRPIGFTYYLDPEMSVHKSYIQRDMPTVIIIDKEGIIRARISSVSADQLIPFINKLL